MSDLGSHWNDLPFWALKLERPADDRGRSARRRTRRSPRRRCSATYEYGPRGDMPAGDADLVPGRGEARALARRRRSRKWDERRAVRRRQGDAPVRLRQARPAAREGLRATSSGPSRSIPKSLGHHAEWIHACKTGAPTTCNFEYAGWLTEANHLGNVAYRAGKKLEWDAADAAGDERPRGRRVHPPRVPQGLGARLEPACDRSEEKRPRINTDQTRIEDRKIDPSS